MGDTIREEQARARFLAKVPSTPARSRSSTSSMERTGRDATGSRAVTRRPVARYCRSVLLGTLLAGLFGRAALMLAMVAVLAGGRVLVARAGGVATARFPFRDGPFEAYESAPSWTRPAMVLVPALAHAWPVFFVTALVIVPRRRRRPRNDG